MNIHSIITLSSMINFPSKEQQTSFLFQRDPPPQREQASLKGTKRI